MVLSRHLARNGRPRWDDSLHEEVDVSFLVHPLRCGIPYFHHTGIT